MKRTAAPMVSVLIPTYNRVCFVGDAIQSALKQTLGDIEVVIVDDGSTDTTAALINDIDDPRVRLIQHKQNLGIPAARNSALETARGKYVAWLDSDDIARPNRLAEQVAFLEANPAIAMVGACAGKLRSNGTRRSGIRVPPLCAQMIEAWLLFRSAFQQSSVTGRAEVLKNYQYDPAYPVCEDIEMFLRLQQKHTLANLPRVLIDRRLHRGQTIHQRQCEIHERTATLARPMLDRIGMKVCEDDLQRHVLLGKSRIEGSEVGSEFLAWARVWLSGLQAANARTQVLEEASLKLARDYFWVLACRAMAARIGTGAALQALVSSPPTGFASSAAFRWAKAAIPAYLKL
ncbi:glycosyltransferase family 2 protein [Sphingobium sp. SCG-1]|uniref:glycosyltransferase family 2 protein n=1 Tax=Sphingobium sp. SCG-1 TaxID=2072936 RepID=UPI0016701739|nr:glycosyltransferase family 2 protein [Sphingobium sp. SCG-1]